VSPIALQINLSIECILPTKALPVAIPSNLQGFLLALCRSQPKRPNRKCYLPAGGDCGVLFFHQRSGGLNTAIIPSPLNSTTIPP
jgi:hypothetical protein